MKWIKKNGINLILIAVFLVGMGLIAYPTVSDHWNKMHQSHAIVDYAERVENLDSEEYDRIWNAAVAYNEEISQKGIIWTLSEEKLADYKKQLDAAGTGMMGYLEIEKIRLNLPIYHGTEDTILQNAVGHIEGSSLPVGGESTHCVLSGHRGLPSAKLFTDLDKLEEGDHFVIRTLNEMLTYEVDQILIVEPHDMSSLEIEEGRDLVTLVTCTPYGVNTHRLLVTGHRIENDEDSYGAAITTEAIEFETILVAPFFAAPVLFILALVVIFGGRKKRK